MRQLGLHPGRCPRLSGRSMFSSVKWADYGAEGGDEMLCIKGLAGTHLCRSHPAVPHGLLQAIKALSRPWRKGPSGRWRVQTVAWGRGGGGELGHRARLVSVPSGSKVCGPMSPKGQHCVFSPQALTAACRVPAQGRPHGHGSGQGGPRPGPGDLTAPQGLRSARRRGEAALSRGVTFHVNQVQDNTGGLTATVFGYSAVARSRRPSPSACGCGTRRRALAGCRRAHARS